MMLAGHEKRSLFGGALRHAGLIAAAAISCGAYAGFTPTQPPAENSTANQAFLFAFGPSAYVYLNDYLHTALFFAPQSYVGPGLSMNAYAGGTVIGANLSMTDGSIWAHAGANILQWFTVTSASNDVLFEWDFSAAGVASAYVYQYGGGIVSTLAAVGSSGAEVLTLSAGNTYFFFGNVAQDAMLEGGGFARISSVPAPGSVVLLGVGLLAARRRRRG